MGSETFFHKRSPLFMDQSALLWGKPYARKRVSDGNNTVLPQAGVLGVKLYDNIL